MPRVISPPLEQLVNLRTLLTDGEREVLDFLNQRIPHSWEIYIQPHLNGLRPDFVLLHPECGIVVVEVKDWDLSGDLYSVSAGKDDSEEPSLYVKTSNGTNCIAEAKNPFNQISLYRDEILRLYCPSFAETEQPKKSQRVVYGLLIFTKATTNDIHRVFDSTIAKFKLGEKPRQNNCRVAGLDTLGKKNAINLIEYVQGKPRKPMNAKVAEDLRSWLVEPEFAADQRRPLELDQRKKDFVLTRNEKLHRKIKGPAGCGKSLVLAARSAQLCLEGKDVLVVTFNITLLLYIRSLAQRWPNPGKSRVKEHLTLLNFHSWCRRIAQKLGKIDEYLDLFNRGESDRGNGNWDEDESAKVLELVLPEFIDRILTEVGGGLNKYDAILVDEGQDFRPEWWNCLRRVLKPDGEMLLAADATQDIYERSELWTDQSMKGCSLSPSWVRLNGSYRSPALLRPILRNFAERFLPTQHRDPPEDQTDFLLATEGACRLSWTQLYQGLLHDRLVEMIFELMKVREPHAIAEADICVVTSNTEQGAAVVKILRNRGFKVVETFAIEEREKVMQKQVEKMKKLKFYQFSGSIKVTTIHSFKGLESRALIIGVSDCDPGLLYTAISRLKRSEKGSHLHVVCDDHRYLEFGRSWPNFKEVGMVDDNPF
jgi:hypothetical protein